MNLDGLLPWQPAAAETLVKVIRARGSALDASDMGTGKSFTAAAVIRELSLPTVVICPEISVTAWHRVGAAMGVEFDALNVEMLRTGRTPYGTWENPRPPGPLPTELWCVSCQLQVEPEKPHRPCIHHPHGIHCVEVRKKKHEYGKFTWHSAIEFLVFDEVHRFGGIDSLNADIHLAAGRQRIHSLNLSATVAESPLNFRSLGYMLGLHNLVGKNNNFYQFAFRMGCKKHPFGGLYFAGDDAERRQKMVRLHNELFPSCGIRIRIADLGDAFPKSQITAELYDLGGPERINRLYREMDGALAELEQRSKEDGDFKSAVLILLRKRQELELLKVPLFVEISKQAEENGFHVAVFVNFTATLHELAKRLKTDCLVYGGQNKDERQRNIDQFQSDESPWICLNADAGGIAIGLHDLLGNFARCGIVSLGYNARTTRQVFGRLPRAGAKSKSLYRCPLVAGSVEEKIHRALTAKLDQIDSLNDGDLMAANLPLTRHHIDDIFPA